MAEDKHAKNKLQQDDPSIIHCTKPNHQLDGSEITKSSASHGFQRRERSKSMLTSKPKPVPKAGISRKFTLASKDQDNNGSKKRASNHASSPKYANSLPSYTRHYKPPSRTVQASSPSHGANHNQFYGKQSPGRFHQAWQEKKRSHSTASSSSKPVRRIDELGQGRLAPNFANSKHKVVNASEQKMCPTDQVHNKNTVKRQSIPPEIGEIGGASVKKTNVASRKKSGNFDVQAKGQVPTNSARGFNKNSKNSSSSAPRTTSSIKDTKDQDPGVQQKDVIVKLPPPSSSKGTVPSSSSLPVCNDAGKEILSLVTKRAKSPSNDVPLEKHAQPVITKHEMEAVKQKVINEILATKMIISTTESNESLNEENDEVRHPAPNKKSLTDNEETARLAKLALEQAGQRLKKDYIVPMEKKSAHFPNAKFYCKVCNYHLDTIPLAHRHSKEKRHRKALKERQQSEQMRNINKPPSHAIEALDDVLRKAVLQDSILDENDIQQRQTAVEELNTIISKELLGCNAVMYGSSFCRIGFKTSDVNVDLEHSGDIKAPAALIRVLDILLKTDTYKQVEPELCSKIPRINFIDVATNLSFELSTGNKLATYTTRLLRIYALLDPRVVQLCMVLRTWARMCKLDQQHERSLPKHSYVLMTIFFMQSLNYLPVLHEMISDWDLVEILSSSTLCERLAWKENSLWYYPTSAPQTKERNVHNLKEHEQSDSESELDISAMSFQDETIDLTFLSSPENFTPGENISGKKPRPLLPSNDSHANMPVALCGKCVLGEKKLGELWLELLKFYAIDYPVEEQVIDIRSSTPISREDKNWSKKRIAVLDPFTSKRNLCRSLNTQSIFAYFMARLKAAVFYFYQLPKVLDNKVVNQKTVKTKKILAITLQKRASTNLDGSTVESSACPSFVARSEEATTTRNNFTEEYAAHLSEAILKNVSDTFSKTFIQGGFDSRPSNSGATNDIRALAEGIVREVIRDSLNSIILCQRRENNIQVTADRISYQVIQESMEEISTRFCKAITISPVAAPKMLNSNKEVADSKIEIENKTFVYEFTMDVITNGVYPTKVCSLCKREGHCRKNCPDEVKACKLSELPPFTKDLHRALDRICKDMFDYFVPSKEEVMARDEICSSLMTYLRQNYNKDTTMNLFGSSRNGFGFRGSDLDICMTFEKDSTGEGLDFVRIIEDVAKQLRRNPALWNILPITTAKVPIVKFQHKNSRLEGDISLYNLLAQRNTAMLLFYSNIDHRCKVLGYVLKAFVKLCNIGDASRGSLSSYAYTLMAIFYLQQKDVPVLPVLQELCGDKERPLVMVDGWNSWFFDDAKKLQTAWSGYSRNKETVGELWLGLLRFYTEEWDFKRNVISIRQKRRLTTFEKEWTSKCISIEDPFDLNHNLAAGVSLKMTNFIIRVFVKAREHFGNMPKVEVRNEKAYFFDPHILMDGEDAPNDRCCKICGKIGHYVRDCPKNRRRRGKDSSNNGNDHADIRCFVCGEVGHIKRDCPQAKKKDGTNQNNSKRNQRTESSPQKSKINSQDFTGQSSSKLSSNGNKRLDRQFTKNDHKSAKKLDVKEEESLTNENPSTSDQSKSSGTAKHSLTFVNSNVSPMLSASFNRRGESQEKSSTKSAPAPSFGAFEDAQVTQHPLSAGFLSNTPPPTGYFDFSKSDKGNNSPQARIPYLSRSAPSSYPWPPVDNQSPRLAPYRPNPALFRSSAQVPRPPVNVMTLGQLESQMMREPGQPLTPSRSNKSATELHKTQQDLKYLEQRNQFGGLSSSVSVVPAAPILGMALTIPSTSYQGLSAPPGPRRTELHFPPESITEQNMPSPQRQHAAMAFGSPSASQWNSYPPREKS